MLCSQEDLLQERKISSTSSSNNSYMKHSKKEDPKLLLNSILEVPTTALRRKRFTSKPIPC